MKGQQRGCGFGKQEAEPDRDSAAGIARLAAWRRVKGITALLLAGSTVRGSVPPGGDIDVIAFTGNAKERSRRMLVREQGCLVELFVIAERDFPAFLEEARRTALPSLVRMCKDGRILAGGDLAARYIREAENVWQAGPLPVTFAELDRRRMKLAEWLDDLMHASRPEAMFVAGKLVEKTAEFILRAEDRWLGTGKWAYRTLEEYEPDAARQLAEAAEAFCRNDDRMVLVRYLEWVLAPYGGPLRDGWQEEATVGGQADMEPDAAGAVLPRVRPTT